jgi:sec-independent protein translocase protein TatC
MADADALIDAGTPGLPVAPEPPTMTPGDGTVMSLVDHLGELRTRLVRSIIALAIGTSIGFLVSERVRDFLIKQLPGAKVIALGLGDGFVIQLKIAFVIGVILAMPVILYQLWAFISPGLTPLERKTVRPWVPLALVFFALGTAIAYFVLPYATSFLLGFTNEYLVATIAAGPYFDFITTMFLAFGLVMEFPILLVGLSRVGIVTSERLTASRRMVILGIAIFAAVATPGGDLVSPFVLGGTMYLLFELTVIFIKRSGR